MAPIPSPEQLARLPCVHPDDRLDPRYVGDAVIRAYRQRGLQQLLDDLGWPAETPAVRIVGGIGVVAFDATGAHDVAVAARPSPYAAISAAEAAHRQQACRTCEHYRAGTDQCGLCGCGFVVAERTRSPVATCPAGRW